MTTIQDFIDQLQREVDSHASGLVDQPMTMDSQIIFRNSDGDDVAISIDSAGGNMFAPAIIVTVY